MAQFLFTTNEMGLHYYHQEMNLQVALRVATRLKTMASARPKRTKLHDLKEISRKSLKCLDLMVNTQPATQNPIANGVFFGKKPQKNQLQNIQ